LVTDARSGYGRDKGVLALRYLEVPDRREVDEKLATPVECLLALMPKDLGPSKTRGIAVLAGKQPGPPITAVEGRRTPSKNRAVIVQYLLPSF
jgi:hypothetical protein